MSQNPIEDAVDEILAATVGNARRALRVILIENIRLRAELDAYRRIELRKGRYRTIAISRRNKI
jgi:hypothetical protein